MTYEEALRKAISCLKLSKSANQHEAALAASKAQEIIDRYHLQVDDIQQGNEPKEAEEEIKNFGYDDPLHEVCQVDTQWTLRLAHVVAEQNACRTIWWTKSTGSSRISVIGRPSDVQTVRYVFGWLNREVRRITSENCKGHSRRYQIDFRYGVVDTIQQRLRQQRAETIQSVKAEAVNPMALVRIETAVAKMEARKQSVDLWVKDNITFNQRKGTFRKQAEWSARQHGREAGEQVRFTRAKADIVGSHLPVVALEP